MAETLLWQQFHFIRPQWLALMIPLLVLVWLRWHRDSHNHQWQRLLPPHLLEALTVGDRGWRKQLPLKLLTLTMALAIVIAAGPTWKRQPSPFGEDKAPLVVILDASESMQHTDVQPSRLIRAKQKIGDLIALREGGQTALVAFAGSAHIAMPLTQDKQVYAPLLAAIDTNIMPRPGKFAETALPLVKQLLASSDGTGTVLLVTDGLGASTLERYRDYFQRQPEQLLVYGIGNPDADGALALDSRGLKQLADASGGFYQTISVDNGDLNRIVRAIDTHMALSADSARPWQDMSYPLVFVVTLLFLSWFRRGWTVQWCLVGVLLMATPEPVQAQSWRFADLWLTPDQQGQLYFAMEDYLTAAERFEDPMWKGMAYYYAEEFDSARSYFMRVDRPQALFNAANALAHQREYLAARDLYEQLLKRHPNFPGARHNHERLDAIINEINEFSESQANTEQEGSRELGDEAPQTAEGAEENVAREQLIEEHYSAEQLLQDPALSERWMRRVQADPARFLATKFGLQQQQREESP